MLKKYKDSGAHIQYITKYLFDNLYAYDLAIEELYKGYHRNLLDNTGKYQLITFLQRRKRYQESIAPLVKLIKEVPKKLQYKIALMHSYFYTDQSEYLQKLAKSIDTKIEKENMWNTYEHANFAKASLTCQLFQIAVKRYNEVITTRRRSLRGKTSDSTLSTYYTKLSQAYLGLKLTDKAVNAACGAILSWGNSRYYRQRALTNLREILSKIDDLENYIDRLDDKTKKTGLDNPIIRKALGQMYMKKQNFKRAITQFTYAVMAQPNDEETQKLLIQCYDHAGDKQGAIKQLLKLTTLARSNIRLYEKLGKRWQEMKAFKKAERAFTNIIEVMPNEAKSHMLLAEIREKQKNWKSAMVHWQHVIRIRTKEPTGYLRLAKVYLKLGKWRKAKALAKKLLGKTWPSHFRNIHTGARKILDALNE